MTSTDIKEGYRTLSSATENANVTPDGAAFWAKVTDPFQDVKTIEVGIPDGVSVKTFVQTFTEQVSITKQSLGLTAAGTWNCHIDILPFVRNCNYQFARYGIYNPGIPGQINGTGIQYPNTTQYNTSVAVGTFTVAACNGQEDTSTSQLYPDGTLSTSAQPVSIAASTDRQFRAYSPAQNLVDDLNNYYHRVVAIAFEVENTTAALYRNGSVTTYRMNSVADQKPQIMLHVQNSVLNPTGAPSSMVYPTNIITLPAPSAKAVQNLPGTATWDATDGCYVVAALDPCVISEFHNRTDRSPAVGFNYFNLAAASSAVLTDLPVCSTFDNMPYQFWNVQGVVPASIPVTSVQTGGAIFQELSPETTLRLTMKISVEYVPVYSSSLLTMARTPSIRDDAALEVYARAIRMIPTGCPRNMNPLGEWFRSMMDILAANAAVIGGAISASLIGNASIGSSLGMGLSNAWGAASKGQKRAF
jgi:hypothetical protein